MYPHVPTDPPFVVGVSAQIAIGQLGGDQVARDTVHQRLQPLGEGGLAAADRTQEIEDLLAFLQPLRGMPEEADDTLDRLFHAVEFAEGRVCANGAIHKDPAEARILRGIHHLRLADRGEQTLGRGGIHHRVAAASFEIFGQRHLGFAVRLEALGVTGEQIIDHWHLSLHGTG